MNNIEKNFSQYFERPTKVQIDVTNKCNFDCRYCYNKNNDFLGQKEFSDEQLLKLVDKVIEEVDPVVISFSGGEPLTRKDILIKAISKLKDKDIYSWLTTNASLMNKEVAVSLKEAGLYKIFTNIDSNSQEVHDSLRGFTGSLSKSLQVIKDLVAVFGGDNVVGTSVVTKENYKSIIDSARLAIDLGVSKYHLLDFVPISKDSQQLMLSRDEWLELKEDIAKSDIAKDIKLQLCHSFLFMSDEYKKMNFPFCMAGRFTMVITASGEVVPCNHLKKKEFLCGNVFEQNLLDIWQKSDILRRFRYYDYLDKGCGNCKRYVQCVGGCKAMAYMLKKDAFGVDPYCQEFNSHEI